MRLSGVKAAVDTDSSPVEVREGLSKPPPREVVHIITGLQIGGAERMLAKLLAAVDREQYSALVISLTADGPVASEIRALGVPVAALDMPAGRLTIKGLLRMARLLRASRPEIVQTWMYHSDLVGGVMARLLTKASVIWGIHQSLDSERSKRHTLATARACAFVSRVVPDAIVSCSHDLARVHVEMGYDATKVCVIPNGFDLFEFQPRPNVRAKFRRDLGMEESAILVGLIARYDPQKDHAMFVRAAAEVASQQGDTHFVLCGTKVDSDNAVLVGQIADTAFPERFHLMGPRVDVSAIIAALDVLALSSLFGEGFPTVIGEAMACGIPCAATAVSDTGYLVGDTGRLCEPGDVSGLAEAICALVGLDADEREALGRAARRRIEEEFEIGLVARRYEGVYDELVAGPRR